MRAEMNPELFRATVFIEVRPSRSITASSANKSYHARGPLTTLTWTRKPLARIGISDYFSLKTCLLGGSHVSNELESFYLQLGVFNLRRFWRAKHIGRSAENTDPPASRAGSFVFRKTKGEAVQTNPLKE
jgi:hypothetical protein